MNKKLRIFVSCVHDELASASIAVSKFVQASREMRDRFDIFTSESALASVDQAVDSRMREVDECDIYVGLCGNIYGAIESRDKSAIELEYERAKEGGKTCLIFVKGQDDRRREPRMLAFIRKVGIKSVYRRFRNVAELKIALHDSLSPHIEEGVQPLSIQRTSSGVHVYFGPPDSVRNTKVLQPAIIFTPSEDSWNDFAQRTRFTYQLTGFPHTHSSSAEVYLAFTSTDKRWNSPADEIGKLIKATRGHQLMATELPNFYTMQPNMQSYRDLVDRLGVENAKNLLLSMNDLVALKQTSRPPSWFGDATASDQFALSFMRQAETFFAFHNAGSILSGLGDESLTGISHRLRLNFKLATFENEHELEFGFEQEGELPKRIAVLIGKNGTGKSQSLSHFARALIDNDKHMLRDDGGNRPSVHRLLAVSSPGETYNTFPTPPRQGALINYRRIFLSKRQYGSNESGLGEALVQLARSHETIKQKKRWDLFCDAVSTVIPLDDVYVPVRHQENPTESISATSDKPFPLAIMRSDGEQHRLERWRTVDPQADPCRVVGGKTFPLSSGQITFLRFAAQTCLHIENGTMLLFDEPETHLHPNLITEFVRLLDKLLEMTGSLAILATHSAYFVREVPQSQVIILREPVQGTIQIATPRLKTLGADIGAISFFVFGDELYGRLLRDLGERLKDGGADTTKLLQQLEKDLPPEAFMFLRRELPSSKKR